MQLTLIHLDDLRREVIDLDTVLALEIVTEDQQRFSIATGPAFHLAIRATDGGARLLIETIAANAVRLSTTDEGASHANEPERASRAARFTPPGY